MFVLIDEIYRSLATWPAIQFAAVVLGGYFGIKMIMRGERDKKPENDTTPHWFVTEQNLDVMRQLLNESRQQTQLLEQIANENVINPRRLQD